ncbi:MAG: enoyl-CoA hydratase/isomerase family protein [Saprospiraceae bacterium]|jgi:enoyl-CoA hydratase|nr:enoyl-CoA hydratase/isomerase family protein [Saprospiraceae bacterium]MCA0332531.1 enoyl-CoA hydratase/isomerase family protein [Bacteroidota bacterium]MCB0603329.1 enoyl-CoA hydratase/isomerase family protein [Saprospiraceae bacterium]MCO5276824.1 enoyl-CoA hydratase-related protein [Saprospiraceae bacterium]
MQFETLLTEEVDSIIILTINRPESLNALNKAVFDDLERFFSEYLPSKTDIRGVVITGAGEKAFVAGADIKEFANFSSEEGAALSRRGQNVFLSIEQCPIPVIAAVNGFALGGGCELAMSCHMRIAGMKAKFGQPEVNLGLTPGYAGTQRLIQLVGKTKGMELLLTTRMVDAEEALRIGLVNQVVEKGQEKEASLTMLKTIAEKAPIAVAKTIQCINAYYDKNIDGFEEEAKQFGLCMETEDFKEGTSAFIEKRKPTFKNK